MTEIIVPRDYQTAAVESLWEYFRTKSGNPVIALPTGTGKSIVIGAFLQSVYSAYPDQRVLVLTHVKELIEQNHDKLLRMWPYAPAGIYSSGLNRKDLNNPITFAGVASVYKKPELWGHIDLIIIDEAHLVSASKTTMYQKFIKELKKVNPFLKVIGLTATPFRLGHGHITEPAVIKGEEYPPLFNDVCFDLCTVEGFNWLIAEGYLCTLVPKSTKYKLDIDGVSMRGGEYVQKQLQLAVDKDEITEAAIRESLELGWDRRAWLVFATGIEHTDNTTDILNMLGVPAVAVHSKMPSKQRDENIAAFKRGEVRAAVNNNVLTTGFDYPAIDLIVVLRPTQSPGLWVQMMGRGTRPFPGKINCKVLDFANNTKRLGPINDPVIPKSKGGGTGEAPVKECRGVILGFMLPCDGVTDFMRMALSAPMSLSLK